MIRVTPNGLFRKKKKQGRLVSVIHPLIAVTVTGTESDTRLTQSACQRLTRENMIEEPHSIPDGVT